MNVGHTSTYECLFKQVLYINSCKYGDGTNFEGMWYKYIKFNVTEIYITFRNGTFRFIIITLSVLAPSES